MCMLLQYAFFLLLKKKTNFIGRSGRKVYFMQAAVGTSFGDIEKITY
jgi:hypothetical protein